MDLKLLKMLCKDSKQHHVIFHELYSVSSLLCIAQNVRFEIPYKVFYSSRSEEGRRPSERSEVYKFVAWGSREDRIGRSNLDLPIYIYRDGVRPVA